MQLAKDTIPTWAKFLTVFGHRQRGLVFRGQSDAEKPLVPSFQRHIPDPNDPVRVEKFECEVLRQFQRRAPTLLAPAIVSRLRYRVDWWAIMQHYNVPTRLLDWTYSAFVAAYFAVSGEPKSKGAIWTIDVELARRAIGIPSTPEDIERDCWDRDVRVIHFPELSIETDRMWAQQTVFSVATRVMEEDHERMLASLLHSVPDDPARPLAFAKYTIPAEAKREFRDNLRQMNITPASLFPGIDGFGRSVAEFAYDRFQADEAVEGRTDEGAPPIR